MSFPPGKKPRKFKEDLPKPTELMQQREAPLELDKNLNKTMIVNNPGGRGPGQPGFFCEVCNRTSKDSAAYLDHINGRSREFISLGLRRMDCSELVILLEDLRKLGQTTNIARSTIEQVRARIAFLREKTKEAANAKAYDFDQRLKEVKAKEDAIRAEQKEKKKAAKEARRVETAATITTEDNDMAAMMGFGGFGSTKK
jgi:U4/U6.U5 tri-snRNP component SNU23